MRGVIGAHGVEPPAAGHGISRFRDRDALVVGAVLEVRPGEVGDDVPVRHRVVDHRRIALVVAVARGARAGGAPERVERERCDRRATRLREDSDRGVDGLHVEARPDVTHRVRRVTGAPRVVIEAVEAHSGTRHAPSRGPGDRRRSSEPGPDLRDKWLKRLQLGLESREWHGFSGDSARRPGTQRGPPEPPERPRSRSPWRPLPHSPDRFAKGRPCRGPAARVPPPTPRASVPPPPHAASVACFRQI